MNTRPDGSRDAAQPNEHDAVPPPCDAPEGMSDALARVWRNVQSMSPEDAAGITPGAPPPRPRRSPSRSSPTDLGIPPLYRRAQLSDYAPRDFELGAWLLGSPPPEPQDVFVHGDNGVGKTHLAAAIARLWGARWCSTLKLLRRVRRTFKPGLKETEDQLIEELTDPRRLVLDDIGSCSLTDFGLATVLGLLEERHTHGRVTIVTCYQSLTALDKVDTSLASRLGAFARVKLIGDDRRLAKGRPG